MRKNNGVKEYHHGNMLNCHIWKKLFCGIFLLHMPSYEDGRKINRPQRLVMKNEQSTIFDFSKLKNSVKSVIRLIRPVPFGLCFLNIIVQRIFQINGDSRWMVNYTSRVTEPKNIHMEKRYGDSRWMVNYTSRVTEPKNIHIGEKVWISFAVSGGCYIHCWRGINGIYIGDHTIFAPGVKIISANHVLDEPNKWHEEVPIQIGKHCWLGANVVILPGVTLGDNCLVGAGAVVTKSFPAGSKIAGVPAKLVE
jgi:acetyltransferase-like isoleucine patch superfamily enzyme